MPDPSQIHGRPLPAPELADGTVTVRVMREAIGNDLPGQQVRLVVGGTTRTATTDDRGRAEFAGLPREGEVRAEVTVDGEALVSQTFAVPASGGVRVALVAGIAKAAERRAEEEKKAAAAPPVKGTVVFGENSRIHMEFSSDTLRVFYLLDIVNSARARVDVGGPLVVTLPEDARSAAALEGSSEAATISGDTITITGPFASGTTQVMVGFTLPPNMSEYTLTQAFPAAMPRLTVALEKAGAVSMASPQLGTVNEVTAQSGDRFLLGTGPALAANTPFTLTLTGLPAHSNTPKWVALGLALGLGLLGTWLAATTRSRGAVARETLIRRRDTLLGELTKLETRRRANTIAADKYDAQRRRLMAELEQIYGELDAAGAGPQGGGEGLAA